MSKTLYRTYRPQKFSDVIGQDHIVKTLQNAITSNRIGHAYLFTGPRGTGKTTVARLFAVAVNTQKRKDFTPVSTEVTKRLSDGTTMDVIEIDAASNTGVDDIRALKETIGVTPTETKYKIYIIDEVHMLSTNAFNALLKTLEEPPEHVIFILATTEVHKVPDTILSRCQRFDFARFSIEDIITKLTMIAEKEKVKISDEALEMIAIAAEGGMRDAESLLAQVFALDDKNITAQEVSEILGTTTSSDVLTMIKSFVHSDISQALITINSIVHDGYNIDIFIRTIIEKLRIVLFLSIGSTDKNIRALVSIPQSEIDILQKIAAKTTPTKIILMIEECTVALQKTKNTTILQLPLEVAAINICGISPSNEETPKTPPKKEMPNNAKTEQMAKKSTKEQPAEQMTKKTIASSDTPKDVTKTWTECIKKIDTHNKSVAHLLTQCELLTLDEKTITLTTTFSFYKDKITQTDNRIMIENIIQNAFNTPLKIKVIIQEKEKQSSELLSYAARLMGDTVTE